MGSFIGLLVGKSIFGHVLGEKAARAIAIGGLFLLILSAVAATKCAYDSGVIREYEQKQEAKQAKRERKADNNLNEQQQRDDQAAQQRKQEIDDATRNIPDQMPSARQRARVCVELSRQAKERGEPKPAC